MNRTMSGTHAGILLASFLFLGASPAVSGAQTEVLDPSDLQIGKPAPEIVGQTIDGEPLRLSDFKGKVVVLDFWGDW